MQYNETIILYICTVIIVYSSFRTMLYINELNSFPVLFFMFSPESIHCFNFLKDVTHIKY